MPDAFKETLARNKEKQRLKAEAQRKAARAQRRKWLLVLLAVAVIVSMLYGLKKWDTDRAAGQLEDARHRPDASMYNPTKICPDAIDHDEDHTAFTGRSFKVPLKEGCFGPFVRMPKAWHDWHTQADGDEEHYWIAAWTNASKTPTRPSGAFADANLGVYTAVRLQGHGTVIFYTPQF